MINANGCTQFIKANAPAILAASTCIGTVTTAVLTAKSTTLAIERVADCEANLRSPDDLSWREKFISGVHSPGHRRGCYSGIDCRGKPCASSTLVERRLHWPTQAQRRRLEDIARRCSDVVKPKDTEGYGPRCRKIGSGGW